MACLVLMPMFASFNRAHPRVELHIFVSNSDASLAQRKADIAIRLSNTPPDTLIGKRVVAFRDHMTDAIRRKRLLFEGEVE